MGQHKDRRNKGRAGPISLPNNALRQVALGQSFAEYDKQLLEPGVFVETPAYLAAGIPTKGRCFFVGRRGTGKTATTLAIQSKAKNTITLNPLVFIPSETPIPIDDLKNTRSRYFKSLVSCYRLALLTEVYFHWTTSRPLVLQHIPEELKHAAKEVSDGHFDHRLMQYFKDIFRTLRPKPNDTEWMKYIRREADLSRRLKDHSTKYDGACTILIDRLDECWDGTDVSVVYLMALMHACGQLASEDHCVRPLLFLRENIFERVRSMDNEFTRLEMAVVSLDWTREQLLEMVERRLRYGLSTKPGLNGETWALFFENPPGSSSLDIVFDFCQSRPRDVLMYVDLAVETAISHGHSIVSTTDLVEARRRFSESRLKDLEDEYSENFPYLYQVLRRFYGLGQVFNAHGIQAIVDRLLRTKVVTEYCKDWIFEYSSAEQFIELLYGIGFLGVFVSEKEVEFRSVGVRRAQRLKVTKDTRVAVHSVFTDALNLQNLYITSLEDDYELREEGIVDQVPGSMSHEEHQAKLAEVEEDLRTLPKGRATAAQFEDAVGQVLNLCFFHSLANVQAKSRTHDQTTIRDWIASNRARTGFWSLIRQQYGADQVVWECKNYDNLKAEDFQQASYYANSGGGRFIVMVFRGEERKPHYLDHVRRIYSNQKAMVLLLTVKDLLVFVRQVRRGVFKDTHIYDRYDSVIRSIG